jgi:ribosomal protein S18 acetylase RimI-like enzyme
VFVGIEPGETRIAGFYALSSFSIGLNLLPQHLGAKLPAYPNVPAALIGRLARHIAYKGRDVGEILLANALRRIARAGRAIDVHVVVVDAKDENAKSFYRRYGFIELAGDPRRLILPVTSIAQTLDV